MVYKHDFWENTKAVTVFVWAIKKTIWWHLEQQVLATLLSIFDKQWSVLQEPWEIAQIFEKLLEDDNYSSHWLILPENITTNCAEKCTWKCQ